MQNTKRNKNFKNNKNKNKNKILKKEFTEDVDSTLIMPPKLRRHLRYNDNTTLRNAAATYFVYSFRVNDLYDPDPIALSGSITGFKEIMQFYQYYRVLNVSVTTNLANNETFALIYGGCFSQSNLTGTIATRDDALNALESTFSSKQRILSAKGGMDRSVLRMSMPLVKILGEPRQYLAELNYAGNGLATPTTPLWFNFIVISANASNLTNGISSATSITFESEFFGLLNLRA